MQSYQYAWGVYTIALHKGYMFRAIHLVTINNRFVNPAVDSREDFLSNPFNQALVSQPMSDQPSDRYNFDTSLLGQAFQVRKQGDGTIVFENLTDYAGRLESR